jgi:hypothetical protein
MIPFMVFLMVVFVGLLGYYAGYTDGEINERRKNEKTNN